MSLQAEGIFFDRASRVVLCVLVIMLGLTSVALGDDGADRPPIATFDAVTGARLEILGGNGQRGAAGSLLGRSFRVRVVDRTGMPLAGVTVQWTVVFGDAVLTAGGTTESDAAGVTANRLQLGTNVGLVEVTVRVAGSDASRFLTAKIDREADPTREAFDRACNDDLSRLDGLCAYVDVLNEEQQEIVLAAIEPNEVSAQATLAMEAARTHLDDISGRLTALRYRGVDALDQLRLAIDDSDTAAEAGAALGTETEWVAIDETRSRERRWGFFVSGSSSSAERPRIVEEIGFDLDSDSLTGGFDYRIGAGAAVGLAIGHWDGEADFFDAGGELALEADWLSLYFSQVWRGGAYVQGVVTDGEGDYDFSRTLGLPVPFRGKSRFTAFGITEGEQFAAQLDIGYSRTLASGLVLTGMVRGRYTDLSIDAYAETGDPDGAGLYLEILEQEMESFLVEGGFDLAWAFPRPWGSLTPRLQLSMVRELDDQDQAVRARFREDDTGGLLVLPRAEPDENFVVFGAGLTARFRSGAGAYLHYGTDLERSDFEVETLRAGVFFAF